MIAHFDQFDAPEFDTQAIANEICRKHKEFMNQVFTDALIAANGSVMPTPEELKARSFVVVEPDGTHHLLWDAPRPEQGVKVDMSFCIATVKPPQI